MGVFDNDIVSRDLLVKHAYDIRISYHGTSIYDLKYLFYANKLWKKNIDEAPRMICDMIGNVSLDKFALWIKENKNGLTRSLRGFFKRHYLRPRVLKYMHFYSDPNHNYYRIIFHTFVSGPFNPRGSEDLIYIEFIYK